MKPVLRIEKDTPLVPRAAAEGVCHEAAVWLHQPLPRRFVRELTAYANTVYAHNARFRRKVRGEGTRGRDYLWVFMRHWLCALLADRRPQLHARLPSSYSVGRPLPPKQTAPPRCHEMVQTPPPPAKLRPRPRPAPDYAFAAAAHFHFA